MDPGVNESSIEPAACFSTRPYQPSHRLVTFRGSSPMSLPAQTMAVSTEKRSTKEKEAIQAVLPLAELILEPGPPGAERVRSIFVW